MVANGWRGKEDQVTQIGFEVFEEGHCEVQGA
jgi:hypothetical protein